MVKFILKEQPRRVIVIDSRIFIFHLSGRCERGFENPIFYVAPPTVWAWRKQSDTAAVLHSSAAPAAL